MRTHTNQFKTNIKEMGREIDSKLTWNNTSYDGEYLFSVTPILNANLLKSVMKGLNFQSTIDIPLNDEINYKFGVLVNGSYEYLDYGNYIVYEKEYNEDSKTWDYTCYDKMVYSMKDYESLNITYPITINNYIKAIANYMGLSFANDGEHFANYNRLINQELYLDNEGNSLQYTFRDVLDELSEVTASCICINKDDELEVRYINNTNDTIDEEYFKDINVKFGETYGPINTIVLSRSADSDNIYYPSPLPTNPFEFKISDNQIMNWDDRADYLPDIYNKLNGLSYSINDFQSTGIMYYELLDRYTASITDEEGNTNTYSCLMLNDEPKINQGLVEDIHTEMPEETVTDYNTASKDDRGQTRASIIVDKMNATITSTVEKVEHLEESIEALNPILDSNVIVLGVDSNNRPFSTNNFDVNYVVKYLGQQITLRPTTTDTHSGITISIDNSKIRFSVNSNTPIPSSSNNYTFTWIYTAQGQTITAQKTIILSTIPQAEVQQNVYIGDTPPTNLNVLWYDSINKVIKKYNPSTQIWEIVNDYSQDIIKINEELDGGQIEYNETTDDTFIQDKTYYKYTNGQYVEMMPGTDYQVGSSTYKTTTDTTFASGKNYFKYEDNTYVPLIEGVDYQIGDNVSSLGITIYDKNVFEQYISKGINGDINDLSSLLENNYKDLNDSIGELKGTLETLSSTILEQTNEQFVMWFKETGLQSDLDDVRNILENTYNLTNDANFIENKKYFKKVNEQYVLLVEGTDYEIGDNINSYSVPVYENVSVQARMNELTQYITFKGASIELGRSDSLAKLLISNERISFMTNGQESAYITGNQLYITDSTILRKLQIGHWVDQEDENGNLNLRWVE